MAKIDEELLLAGVGVYKTDEGYFYGGREDKDGNLSGNTAITVEQKDKLVARIIEVENKAKVAGLDGDIETILENAGYSRDDDQNYVGKDRKNIPPEKLIEIASSQIETHKLDIKDIAAVMKKCGVASCNERLHPVSENRKISLDRPIEGKNAGNIPNNKDFVEHKEPLTNPNQQFNLAEAQKAIGLLGKQQNKEAIDSAFKESLSENGELNWSKFASNMVVKQLIPTLGESYLKGKFTKEMTRQYMQSGDPNAPSQVLKNELDKALVKFQHEFKLGEGSKIELSCGADYDITGAIIPSTGRNGLTTGCAVAGKF